jgi:hypothetical protein
MDMLAKLLRMPRGVEVGVAIPIGCLVPLAIAAAVLVGAGVLVGQRFQPGTADHVTVRVIDDGAAGGPKSWWSAACCTWPCPGRRVRQIFRGK